MIECKRIWSADNSLALKYVREGIARFASGKYAMGHSCAAMCGYVLCDNQAGCIDRIKATLESEPESLTGYDKRYGWENSGSIVPGQTVGNTKHAQPSLRYKLRLVHTTVGIS